MKSTNRRESPRIAIQLPCRITSPSVWQKAAVYTENISRSGVLVGWRDPEAAAGRPTVGQIVTVEIELPAHHSFGPKCIHCQGTVVRVGQAEPDSTHMALRVNYMDFRSFHDRLRALETARPAASNWTV